MQNGCPAWVGVDVQGLIFIVGSVEEKARPESKHAVMLNTQVAQAWNGGIEVQHLRSRSLRPCRLWQVRHLLERQPGGAGGVAQHQPVVASRVGGSCCGWLVTWAVVKAQQLPVELGKGSCVFAVQHDLAQSRNRRFSGVAHARMLPDSRAECSETSSWCHSACEALVVDNEAMIINGQLKGAMCRVAVLPAT